MASTAVERGSHELPWLPTAPVEPCSRREPEEKVELSSLLSPVPLSEFGPVKVELGSLPTVVERSSHSGGDRALPPTAWSKEMVDDDEEDDEDDDCLVPIEGWPVRVVAQPACFDDSRRIIDEEITAVPVERCSRTELGQNLVVAVERCSRAIESPGAGKGVDGHSRIALPEVGHLTAIDHRYRQAKTTAGPHDIAEVEHGSRNARPLVLHRRRLSVRRTVGRKRRDETDGQAWARTPMRTGKAATPSVDVLRDRRVTWWLERKERDPRGASWDGGTKDEVVGFPLNGCNAVTGCKVLGRNDDAGFKDVGFFVGLNQVESDADPGVLLASVSLDIGSSVFIGPSRILGFRDLLGINDTMALHSIVVGSDLVKGHLVDGPQTLGLVRTILAMSGGPLVGGPGNGLDLGLDLDSAPAHESLIGLDIGLHIGLGVHKDYQLASKVVNFLGLRSVELSAQMNWELAWDYFNI